MTVKELIAKLQTFNENLEVFIIDEWDETSSELQSFNQKDNELYISINETSN